MDIGGIMLSEYVRERKTNTTYMWNLKPKQMNSHNKTKPDSMETENKLVVAKGEGVRQMGETGEGD